MVSVVVVGALCELGDDDDTFMPAFVYDCPALRPRVVTLPAPANTETLDPDTVTSPLRRWYEWPFERPPRPWFRRRFDHATLVHTTLDQTPGFQRRWMEYRERRSDSVSLSVTEFADLSDGRRVILRNDRGYGWGWETPRAPGLA